MGAAGRVTYIRFAGRIASPKTPDPAPLPAAFIKGDQLMKTFICAAAVMIFFGQAATSRGCTTMLATRGATADGSLLVAHSDDDELSDQRIIYVPAADHPPGSKRPVHPLVSGPIRFVGSSRGPGYLNPALPSTPPLGYIDQVPHTYAYFDGNYGIMNEHQLMIGECTDGARVEPKAEPGKRIFYSAELSRVALERCTRAREAVRLMGRLIDEFGYYGTGETLLVGDPEEGWVFEMCGAPGGASLWVAKRVPDGEFFVAANEFRIRDIEPGAPDTLYSKNLFAAAEKAGWWNPDDGPLDWLRTVSNGEYNHPYYSLRRVWRVMSRVNPSLKLSPWVKNGFTRDYPFSIKPEKKLTAARIMELYRDHYDGTEFDLSRGLAAGPFGNPSRYIGPYDGNQNNISSPGRKLTGAWERPVSIFYCGYSYVCRGRNWLPDPIGGVAWIGLDEPYTTCYIPFYCGVTKLPESYRTGTTRKFDPQSAWWAFNFASQTASRNYALISAEIKKNQAAIENKERSLFPAVEKGALDLQPRDPSQARSFLTEACRDNAGRVIAEWWKMAGRLIAKFNDGYINVPDPGGEIGYPAWWREDAGYRNGPVSYQKLSTRGARRKEK